jgi:DNA-binding transcriptional LysR family regulator
MRLRDHLEKLHVFTLAFETGSFKQTSQLALVSQPQVTRTIKILEDLIGKPLFIRSSSGVIATKVGQELYVFAKKLMADSESIELLLRSGSSNLRGVLEVGTYDSIARYFFPSFIHYLRGVFPDLTINLTTDRSQTILSKLEKGRIDLALTVGQSSHPHVSSELCFEDHFAFYETKNLESGFRETLICFEETKHLIPAQLKKTFSQVSSCNNLETVLSLTLDGLGVGFLPTKVAQTAILSHRLIESVHNLESQKSKHGIYLSFRKKKSENLKTILEELRRYLSMSLN